MTRGTGQHNDLGVAFDGAVPRLSSGPIAVLPRPDALFVDAVIAGGGTVDALSDSTRGIVWLSEKDADGLAVVLDAHPDIQWVQLPWAGVDAFAHVLRGAADSPVPVWTSAKGAYSEPVAEHALALTLACLRELAPKARTPHWVSPKTGRSLYGRHVVIVGAGGIAREIIRVFSVFDVTITVVRRSVGALDGAHSTVTTDQLANVLPLADVVIIAAASTDATAHLIGEAELAAMKDSAVLVNIARGALVDQDALAVALREGVIAAAGIDVTSPEPLPESHALWGEPHCLITSHSADTPEMTAPLLAGRITRNTRAFLGNGQFVGVVDPVAGY